MIRKWILLAALAAAFPAMAQTQPDPTCTDVTVGTAHGYDCLNAQLAATAHAVPRPSSDTNAPLSATSPGNRVGVFNESGTRNRLGANFGKSAIPAVPAQNFPPAFAPRK